MVSGHLPPGLLPIFLGLGLGLDVQNLPNKVGKSPGGKCPKLLRENAQETARIAYSFCIELTLCP